MLGAVLAASISTVAMAQYYVQQNRIGNSTYYNGSDGYSGTSNKIGNTQYYNDNRGNNCTTSYIGDHAYTNCY
jgi:hypothetical protein